MYLHSRDTEAVLLMTDIFCLLVQCFSFTKKGLLSFRGGSD